MTTKKHTRIKVAVGLGVAVALLSGGAIAASSSNFADKGLDAGIGAAEVNPVTKEAVITDQFDNIPKKLGEVAGLVDEQTNKSLFSISVNNIRTSNTCPSRIAGMNFAPENGTFLILDIEASVASAMTDKVGSSNAAFMPLVAEAFSVTGKDGTIDRNVTSQAAWSCYDDEQLIPAVVNPGQSVRGKLVLDVAHSSGKVAYDPENNGGWSWSF